MSEPTTEALAVFHELREKTYDGPFIWGPSEGTPAEYLAAALKATKDHGDAQEKAYVVQSNHHPEDPVTVAYCGNGPRSHRNAALIAHVLNNLPWLLRQIEERPDHEAEAYERGKAEARAPLQQENERLRAALRALWMTGAWGTSLDDLDVDRCWHCGALAPADIPASNRQHASDCPYVAARAALADR
jgi:hypothetical protein